MKRLPIFITLVALAVALIASARPRKASASAEDSAKADYIFLEALREKSQGNPDAAFELLRRAHELNPSDRETGMELSAFLLSIAQHDTTNARTALGLMKDYWEANPSDYYSGVRYGLLNDNMGLRSEGLRVWNTMHRLHPDKIELTYRLADVLAQGGDAADRRRAIEIYDSIELTEGPNIPLSGKKIQIYLIENDTLAVVSEADRLRQASPSNVDFQVFSGDVYSMMGRKEQALGFFDRAVELDPSSGYARYSKAQYFNEIGDSAGFDREVFVALRQNSLDVDTKLMLLRSYISEMIADSVQQPRIRELFDTLLVVHPLEHDIHDLYSRFLITVRDYKSAAEQTEQTLGLDPADPQGWEMLASLYLQTEEYDRAADAIVRSFRYYPDNGRQHLMLGSIYSQDGKPLEAIGQYKEALELTDDGDAETLSRIYGAWGDALYSMEQADSAFTYYKKAILYDPTNYLAMNNSAYFMACEGGDLDEALRLIEKVVAAEPDQATSLDTYAWVLFKRKDYTKAREIMDRVLLLEEGNEPSADVLDHAGDIYFMDGEPRKAIEFWKKALTLDPDNEKIRRKVKEKCLVKD